jgi:CheY-like chemotaxis protein
MNILIIDDSPHFTSVLKESLLDFGHHVEIYLSEIEFINNLSKISSFDLIILDVIIIDRSNLETINYDIGLDILKKIRDFSNIPVVLNSAMKYSSLKEKINHFKNISFITKDSRIEEYIYLINAMTKNFA